MHPSKADSKDDTKRDFAATGVTLSSQQSPVRLFVPAMTVDVCSVCPEPRRLLCKYYMSWMLSVDVFSTLDGGCG